MVGKKGESFVSVLTVIGAVLIAVGVAWLIAQNWHTMSAAVKIFILVFFTLAAFTAAVFLEHNDYKKVAKSLYVLGNALLILTVFQIAQIFHYGTTLQANTWLFLICLVGVGFTSYLFYSYTSMVLAFILFLIWVVMQYFSLYPKYYYMQNQVPLILLAILLMAVGIIFYALYLLHKKKNHSFSRLYHTWSIVYFLGFGYLLSFQILIPMYWQGTFAPNSASIFVISFAIISAAILTYALLKTDKDKNQKIEAYGLLITIGAFLLLLLLTKIAQTDIGACVEKQCYLFRTPDECDLQKSIDCTWTENQFSDYGYCTEKNCYQGQNEIACEQLKLDGLGCQWQPAVGSVDKINNGYCTTNCTTLMTKESCERPALKNQGCSWTGNNCVQDYNKNYYGENTCRTNNKNACAQDEKCYWDKTNNYNSLMSSSNSPIAETVWIIINIIFLAFIICVILYGTIIENQRIINIGILVFTLDIITRYVGFIIDLRWYDNLALLFISGGIVLILGGVLIERWRRKLISKIQKK